MDKIQAYNDGEEHQFSKFGGQGGEPSDMEMPPMPDDMPGMNGGRRRRRTRRRKTNMNKNMYKNKNKNNRRKSNKKRKKSRNH